MAKKSAAPKITKAMQIEIDRRVQLAVAALDDSTDILWRIDRDTRDRYDSDRETILRDALIAWRQNPLARRIVSLTTDYVVGTGLRVECKDDATQRFINEFWDHYLNQMSTRCADLCDELTRAGEIYIVLSTEPASGLSFIRALPAINVQEIVTTANDVEQEIEILEKPAGIDTPDPTHWAAYNPLNDNLVSPVVFHFAVNRPVGDVRGESDLAPMLRWLSRYGTWLEDRARLNHFRNLFMFQVQKAFDSEAKRKAREQQLNANPPAPGSILVTDPDEIWSVLQAKLESHEASEDGLALKKMIAAGAGIPLHFLAEPESATRTTATESGGPTFRHYERRQQKFVAIVTLIMRAVLSRRARVDHSIDPHVEIVIRAPEISTRDNVSLAQAGSNIMSMLIQLHGQGVIDDSELLRLAYKFVGEVVDVTQLIAAARAAGARTHDNQQPAPHTTPDERQPEPNGQRAGGSI